LPPEVGYSYYVVNFELPNIPQKLRSPYGRTGRAGTSGLFLLFVDETSFLRDIENWLDWGAN
jgi:superfamily II DNA/RNA helicase